MLCSLGDPSMVVLQFGFGSDAENPHLPHNHEENQVVYTGTHDNDTESTLSTLERHGKSFIWLPGLLQLLRILKTSLSNLPDLMVDLFFYREPEEAKEEEQEDAPAHPEYTDYGVGAIGADWSSAQLTEGQWATTDSAGPVAPATGWTAADSGAAEGGWDAADAPPVAAPPAAATADVAPTGWD